MKNYKNIDEYITSLPDDVQVLLQKIRNTIHAAAPAAEEAIKYGIPTFVLNGNLVHFGGYKKHIGFYATPTGHIEFANELSNYKQGKGSVQFPVDHPIPYWLIEQIVIFRVKENELRKRL